MRLRFRFGSASLALLLSACLKRETTLTTPPVAGPALPPTTTASVAPLPRVLPQIEIPLHSEDPALATAWQQSLLKLTGESPRSRLYAERPTGDAKTAAPIQAWIGPRVSALPTTWIMPTDTWLMEPGAVYSLGLSPGEGAQDSRNWIRILRETQNLIESPTPVFPFRASLKLRMSAADAAMRVRFTPLTRYIDVQVAAQATKLEIEVCERFRRWFSTRQLLAGRAIKASNRNKETISLSCHLLNWTESPKASPFLQIAELPLPIIDPERQELLFRNPADLLRWEQLQRLPSLAQPPDAI